jgi:hypothetical protein
MTVLIHLTFSRPCDAGRWRSKRDYVTRTWRTVVGPTIRGRLPSYGPRSSQGWRAVAGGASRNICPWCENAIRDRGGELVGPLFPGRVTNKLVDGRNAGWKYFGERDSWFRKS